tara:strand:- start:4023 stop:5270 length:1248 start_codon:yes stop_codon:yes gene_type:complete
MTETLLQLLRCPFCGTSLQLVANSALTQERGQITSGVLGCECCAFPIVAGIPVLIADDRTRQAMHTLEAGKHDEALAMLLGLGTIKDEKSWRLLSPDTETNLREALQLLSPNAEGSYFLHRFSDPTFVPAEALLRAVLQAETTGPLLDLCGGVGHLTRVLDTARPVRPGVQSTITVDLHFWKLWIATRFTLPGCTAICCSAEDPLPFASNLFPIVTLMDAFPYIWHKRLCASEMARVVRPDGLLALPHLHNALGNNVNSGDPLSPSAYRNLFAGQEPRLFSDKCLLDEVLEHQMVDLSNIKSPDQLGSEPSLTLIASQDPSHYRQLPIPDQLEVTGELQVNPLYKIDHRNGQSYLQLSFPSPDYEAEFGACRRYLPDTLTIDSDLRSPISPASLGTRYAELRRSRVLIDAPPRYT